MYIGWDRSVGKRVWKRYKPVWHKCDWRNNLFYLFPFFNSCSKNFVASLAPLSYFFNSSSAEITTIKKCVRINSKRRQERNNRKTKNKNAWGAVLDWFAERLIQIFTRADAISTMSSAGNLVRSARRWNYVTTYSAMIGQFFDTMTVASSDKQWS